MAHTAPTSPANGLSTLADAAAAAKNLALGMPSTSAGTAPMLTLNPPSDCENTRPNAQRRLELEDRVDEEEKRRARRKSKQRTVF